MTIWSMVVVSFSGVARFSILEGKTWAVWTDKIQMNRSPIWLRNWFIPFPHQMPCCVIDTALIILSMLSYPIIEVLMKGGNKTMKSILYEQLPGCWSANIYLCLKQQDPPWRWWFVMNVRKYRIVNVSHSNWFFSSFPKTYKATLFLQPIAFEQYGSH